MRILILCLCFVLISLTGYSQKRQRKLTKDEMSKMTQDQRLVYEHDRKSKRGKKELSLKKKERISKRQDRKSKHIRAPKRRED